MTEPLVSIVTPVLNAERYLETCINSVLAQTYQNIEQLIVDGGSTDRSLAIVSDYMRDHPSRIRLVHGDKRGVGRAVNQGIQASTGRIVGWLDADDFYKPDAIRTVVDFFVENPQAYFVYAGCNVVDKDGKPFNEFPVPATKDTPTGLQFVMKPFDPQTWILDWNYMVMCCAAWFKREVVEVVGPLNELGNDLDFELRVAKHFKMHLIPQVTSNWRLHPESISTKQSPREAAIRNERLRQDFWIAFKFCGPQAAMTAWRPRRHLENTRDRLAQRHPLLWKGLNVLLTSTRMGIRLAFGLRPGHLWDHMKGRA